MTQHFYLTACLESFADDICIVEAIFTNRMFSINGSTIASTNTVSPVTTSKKNTGAIAGGVVGGVCGILVIMGLIWLFYRRRQSNKANCFPTDLDHLTPYSKLGSDISPNDPKSGAFEVAGDSKAVPELDSQLRTELPSDNTRHELPTNYETPSELP